MSDTMRQAAKLKLEQRTPTTVTHSLQTLIDNLELLQQLEPKLKPIQILVEAVRNLTPEGQLQPQLENHQSQIQSQLESLYQHIFSLQQQSETTTPQMNLILEELQESLPISQQILKELKAAIATLQTTNTKLNQELAEIKTQSRQSIKQSSNSEPTAAETSQAANRISESTPPADSDQTRMGQNLRLPDDVRNFDGLHSRPDAAISATSNQSAASADAKQPTQISLKWQDYCDLVNESNPVKRDEKVVRLAIADGKQQKRSSRELRQAVNRLLQQSPYVQWMREVQGDEKTNAYTKLTIQAAYQPERTSRRHEAQQRQRQKTRHSLR